MQSKEKDNLIIIRLFPDEDIMDELKKVCRKHNVVTAVVISGIGQMKQFVLGYFRTKGDYTPETFNDTHELLCLSGNISLQGSEYFCHLHATLGDIKKQVIGGHLIKGKVEATNEIVLLKTDMKVIRKMAETSSTPGLFLEEESGR